VHQDASSDKLHTELRNQWFGVDSGSFFIGGQSVRQINAVLVLILMSSSFSSFAGDKKQPRSLAADAVILNENGPLGWVSGVVTVSMDDGKKKANGKLFTRFSLDEGKASGNLKLEFHDGKGMFVGPALRYELMEKDGKRFIKISEQGGKKEPKVRAIVEYSLKSDELTIKGGLIPAAWGFWDVDLTKGVLFKASRVVLP
jgi:hypothetical protein